MGVSDKSFFILHGEDNAADIRIMGKILQDMGYEGDYKNLSIGDHIVDYVLRQGDYADESLPKPDLIILDVGLPGMNGVEALQFLRENENSKGIPIFMLSGSDSVRDYQRCIDLGANAYVQKAFDLEEFSETCQRLIAVWMRLLRQKFC